MTTIDRIAGLTEGVAVKAPCAAATTADILLSGLQIIDDVALAAGDRVLVKSQSTASQNGIWVASGGAWTRALDFNDSRDVVEGTIVKVNYGTLYANQMFALATPNPVVGTSALSFTPAFTFSSVTVSPFMQTVLDDLTASAARSTLGVTDPTPVLWTDIGSATTTNIGGVSAVNLRVTGTTTITSLGTVASGTTRVLRFADALTLTHNATSLILPGAANITTAANDTCTAVSLGSGNWIVVSYQPAAGYAPYLAFPSQTSNSGKLLTTNGSTLSWASLVPTRNASLATAGGTSSPTLTFGNGITAVSRSSQGVWGVTMTALSSANYTVMVTGSFVLSTSNLVTAVSAKTTTSFEITFVNASGTASDPTGSLTVDITVIGGL